MNAPQRPPWPPHDPHAEFRALIERLEKAIRSQRRMTMMNFVMFGYIAGSAIGTIIDHWWP